jgi:hypothetical protein
MSYTDLECLINSCGATDSGTWDLYDVDCATGKPRPLFSKPGTDPWREDKRPDACGETKHLVEADCDRVNRSKRQINRCSGRQRRRIKKRGKAAGRGMCQDGERRL